ncbi:MAG TPA: ShlB/FhaC/HecB family hemolysin secretion/activation protein, partial [Gemmatimonadaceae bacterium]|nr:ShlB/FhaC/HecB family hemolysin secretion/activation protein [Gemmatimonadaceae bacterium]
YLGGAHTVRGQSPDTTQSGNAFWLGRAELGYAFPVVRPAIFGDIGWVGSRDALDQIGRPLSGAGVGASIMDGLVRFDVSRGFYPRKQWRVDMYIEAKF